MVSRTTLNTHTAVINGSNNSQMCHQAVAGPGLSNELIGSDQSFGCQSYTVLLFVFYYHRRLKKQCCLTDVGGFEKHK